MISKLECPRLEQRFVTKFLMTDKWKPYEIYRSMCNMYGEACFHQKIFTIGLNIGLPLQTWIEKTVHGVETHWLATKEKVPGAAVCNNDAEGLLGYERTHDYWFLWKRCNCNEHFLLPRQNSSYLLNDSCISQAFLKEMKYRVWYFYKALQLTLWD